MKTLFTFFLIFSSLTLFSQKITGVILDAQTKKPIEKAHVFFVNNTVYTNEKGEFTFLFR